MPVSGVTDGQPITEAWGDSVSTSVNALEAIHPGSAHDIEQISYPDSPAAAADYLARIKRAADTEYRLRLGLASGGEPEVLLGPGGTTAPDLRIRRTGAKLLAIDDGAGGAVTVELDGTLRNYDGNDRMVLLQRAAGDANDRLAVGLDFFGAPMVRFGPGSAAIDARLARNGTKTLEVDDANAGAATLNVVGSITDDGVPVKAVRTATGTVTALATGSAVDVTVTWSTAFANTNYRAVGVYSENAAAAGQVNVAVVSKTTTQTVFRVRNDSGASRTGQLDCLGVPD